LPAAHAIGLIALAAVGYWIAFATAWAAAGIFIALPCLCVLWRWRSSRQAFYVGLAAGVVIYLPHLLFFWLVFGAFAPALWVVAGLPVGVFLMLLNLAHRRLPEELAFWLTPILWTGVEYARSELWHLRFAWLLPGQAAAFLPGVRMLWIGVYGLGFLYMLASVMIVQRPRSIRIGGVAGAVVLTIVMYAPALPPTPGEGALHVAGVQLEFQSPQAVADTLDQLAAAHPEAQILVLSEYSFTGPVPQIVRDVVRKYHRYFIAGGIKMLEKNQFADTAFVLGPDGEDVFEQGKSVPVQFMDDGIPAAQRRVLDSPWGKIGIAVCYDISYARVMDDFVRQGAQGLIVPTMDVIHWGEYERRMLHGRLGLVRSAEYGIPTFSIWSSGESQLVDRYGRVIAKAGYPGHGDVIAGAFDMQSAGCRFKSGPVFGDGGDDCDGGVRCVAGGAVAAGVIFQRFLTA
jgi:nitrilase